MPLYKVASSRGLVREAHLYDCTASTAGPKFDRAVSYAEVSEMH